MLKGKILILLSLSGRRVGCWQYCKTKYIYKISFFFFFFLFTNFQNQKVCPSFADNNIYIKKYIKILPQAEITSSVSPYHCFTASLHTKLISN